jgi:hypothetical protein
MATTSAENLRRIPSLTGTAPSIDRLICLRTPYSSLVTGWTSL